MHGFSIRGRRRRDRRRWIADGRCRRGAQSLGRGSKGLVLHQNIDWLAVRLVYDSEALRAWAGKLSGPIAVNAMEAPLAAWDQIVLLAERLAPQPSLIPADPVSRVLAFDLGHELLGERGLAWMRRLQLVHAGLMGAGGFPTRVAKYLAAKYGYCEREATDYGKRVADLLRSLATRLLSQRDAGSPWFLGTEPTFVDVFAATCMAVFAPLPHEQCAMDPIIRAAFEHRDVSTEASLHPILLQHRDQVYAQLLELPLTL